MYRILIVDDELYIRKGLEHIIKWEDYGFCICACAKNGEEALRIYNNLEPDLVITDINMPVMDGLDLIKSIRNGKKGDAKFIVLSGYSDFKYAQEAMKYNVENYLLKPLEEDDLINALNEIRHEIDLEREKEKKELSYEEKLAGEMIRKAVKGQGDIDDFISNRYNLTTITPFCYILVQAVSRCRINSITDNRDIPHEVALEIFNKIKSHTGPDRLPFIIEELSGNLGIVFGGGLYGEYKSPKDFVSDLYKSLKSMDSINIIISVGQEVRDFNDINISYKTAHTTREYILYTGEEGILYYSDISPTMDRATYEKMDMLQDLINAIENNNKEEVQDLIEAIVSWFKKMKVDPKLVKMYILDFILETRKIIEDFNGSTEMPIKYYYMFERSFHLLSLDELKKHLLDYSNFCISHIGELRSNLNLGIIGDILSYIEKNYNSNITLKSMAKKHYMNPAYLGQLFKKRLGISFGDYLNQYRIDMAKKMLVDTNLKIYEIAERVGYCDSNYFVARFTKTVNMTPTEYKTKHLGVKG